MTDTVKFNKKSSWQKSDCLCKEEGCLGDSTLQADYGFSSMRCCENEKCKNAAADLAIRMYELHPDNKTRIMKMIKPNDNKKPTEGS